MGRTGNVAITSADRMRKLREKRKQEMSQEESLTFKKKEAARQRVLRVKKKEKLGKDPVMRELSKKLNRLRQQNYRISKVETVDVKRKARRERSKALCAIIKGGKDKKNEIRRLKRDLRKEKSSTSSGSGLLSPDSGMLSPDSGMLSPDGLSSTSTPSLLNLSIASYVSPAAKRRAVSRISTTEELPRAARRTLNTDRDRHVMSGRPSILKQRVKEFMHSDEVSMGVPDEKYAGKRFRLDDLKVLHLRFLADRNEECSYEQFTRIVCETCQDVIKPNCTTWGTCLCGRCLNPELKLEGLRRIEPKLFKPKEYFTEASEDQLAQFFKEVEATGHIFKYNEWRRVKNTDQENPTSSTHQQPTTTTTINLCNDNMTSSKG